MNNNIDLKKQSIGIWIKDKLPDTKGYYCCKIIIDGSDDDLAIIEFDGRQWGEIAYYVYETLDIIEWLKLVDNVYVLNEKEIECLGLNTER